MKPILLDTRMVVALLDRSERHHVQSASVVAKLGRPLVTCEAVIAESYYLLRRLSGVPEVVLENVVRGVFLIPFQLSRVATPVRNIMRTYSEGCGTFKLGAFPAGNPKNLRICRLADSTGER